MPEILYAGDLGFDLDDMIEAAEASDRLSEWESEFMESTAARYERHGRATTFTEKQAAVLRAIYDKVG